LATALADCCKVFASSPNASATALISDVKFLDSSPVTPNKKAISFCDLINSLPFSYNAVKLCCNTATPAVMPKAPPNPERPDEILLNTP
jgi:hypothetical protein